MWGTTKVLFLSYTPTTATPTPTDLVPNTTRRGVDL